MHSTVFVVIVVLIALSFDFTNGFHDSANAIATSVSTHALSPRMAVLIAAVMNFLGAFTTLKVAITISQDIVDPAKYNVSLLMVLAALIGAICWNLLTWAYGLPSSSSHALIGGLVGAGIASLGFSAISWSGVFHKMIIPLVFSPIIGFVLAYAGMLLIFWVFRQTRPRPVHRGFRFMQIFSSAFVSFSHGTNDAQKTMGVIALALVGAPAIFGQKLTEADVAAGHIPTWVVASAATAMALGTYTGGWRIVKTMGTRLYKMDPTHGFDAQTIAATVIQGASHFGFPVSTTHVVTGSVLGAGSSQSFSAVRWGVGINIVLAWIITLPMAAIFAAIVYGILHAFVH